MNPRTLVLTGMALLGMAIVALPQPGFAQSSPFLGTWQLNLAKSKFSPGPAPRSVTVNEQAEGQNYKQTITGTDGAGNPISVVIARFYDGMPHPSTNANWDAVAFSRVDDHTYIGSRMKAGKLVGIETLVLSPDGKTLTTSVTGDAPGGRQQVNSVAVYDKQ